MPPPKSTPALRSTADFARYVGLSRSTISRALNGHDDLRAKTMHRVRAALEETGFTPNAHALHLRGKRAAMVGVCMENFLTPTAVSKVSVLQQRLRDRGLTTLIEVLDPKAGRRTLQHFLSLRVGAVVYIGHFAPAELRAHLDALNRHGTPHVVIDDPGLDGANTISLNRIRAMTRVTSALLDAGHRRFGLLGISGAFHTVSDRLAGIQRALRRAGLDPAIAARSLDHLHPRGDHFEYGARLARSFLAHAKLPTAFIAVNDETAVGALLEFQAAGKRVPDDFSIVGFNNQNICLMTRPQLTSVDQQIGRTIDAAVATLTRQIGRSRLAPPAVQWIEPLLVERGSTGPAKK